MLVTVIVDENMTEDQLPDAMARPDGRRQPRSRSPSRSRPRCSTPASTASIINMPGYVPGAITTVGEALRPVVGL